MKKSIFVLLFVMFAISSAPFASAQGFHAKKEARKKEAEKPKALAGGVKFEVSKPFDEVFEKCKLFLF